MSACRGPVANDADVPCIHVRYVRGQLDAVEHAQYGIEEERVPWTLAAASEDDPVSIAYDAASESRLKIGVAISASGSIALHHKRLPATEPLFALDDPTIEQARRVGGNAARLAKRLPLKSVA